EEPQRQLQALGGPPLAEQLRRALDGFAALFLVPAFEQRHGQPGGEPGEPVLVGDPRIEQLVDEFEVFLHARGEVGGDQQEAAEEVGVLLVGILVDAGEEVDPGGVAISTLIRRDCGSASPASGYWRTTVSAFSSESTSLNSTRAWARLRARRRACPSGSPRRGGAIAGVSKICSAMLVIRGRRSRRR